MKSLLKKENIKLIKSVKDWKEAISVSLKTLLEKGYINENYEKAIIELTEKYGPYYVLIPNVALIHARPEDGVINNQIAVTLLEKEVIFSSDKLKTVKLLISLAAKNNNDHLCALKKISELMTDRLIIEKILNSKNPDEIYDAFTN